MNASVFNSKEEYLAFRARWKQLYKEGYHRPVEEKIGITKQDGKWVDVYGKRSPLRGIHHLAYALARGHVPPPGFATAKPDKIGARLNWVVGLSSVPDRFSSFGVFEPFGDALTGDQKLAVAKRLIEYARELHSR